MSFLDFQLKQLFGFYFFPLVVMPVVTKNADLAVILHLNLIR